MIVLLGAIAITLISMSSAQGSSPRQAEPSTFARFSLRGTHGYRVTIRGSGKSVSLIVTRRHAAAIYTTDDAAVTASGIQARFGNLGNISVSFIPSRVGRGFKNRSHCEQGSGGKVRFGSFVGSIRFRGERGFTQVSAKRASGVAIERSLAGCAHAPDGSSGRDEAILLSSQDPPSLEAFSSGHGGFAYFTAGSGSLEQMRSYEVRGGIPLHLSDLPHKGIPYSATSTAHRGAMHMVRLVAAMGPRAGLVDDETPNTKAFAPPRPFTGVGRFSACPSRKWGGTLRVSFPGRPNEILTGPSFVVVVHPGGDCPQPR
jgi:hypothetical protein